MMKQFMLMMIAALLMVACATPEERAARQAENLKMVKAAVGTQQYRINVTSMRPMRGTTTNVMGRWLKIDGNTVDCSLPYIGRDDIPHMKTRAEVRMDSKLEFKAEVQRVYHIDMSRKFSEDQEIDYEQNGSDDIVE